MEYPSKYDFFLRFKAINDDENRFVDYILISVSDNFMNVTGIKAELILGKKISEIAFEYEKGIFGLKDIYYNMIPKTRKKFSQYIDELGRWYLINIFSDEKDYLLLFYSDASRLVKSSALTKTYDNNSADMVDIEKKRFYYGYKDSLTGLYNRHFFEEELLRVDSPKYLPVSIIMCDLNVLKLINDAFGHDMGDKALIKTAELMKKNFRKEDIVSRVGGDEFVILLPKTPESTAKSILKRIKSDTNTTYLGHIKMSISLGTATKNYQEEDILKVLKRAEDKMYFNKLKESKEAKISLINHLRDKLEEITCETREHYERLKKMCALMADKLNLTRIEREELDLLCEFHDIGKIGVPSKILEKREKLNSDEWDEIKRHSKIGYHIVRAWGESLPIDELILVHHERWDGKGYPGLLEKDEIPLSARIFAITDAYDAMVNGRPYKKRISNSEALKEIESKAGTQFDPKLAMIFVEAMKKKKAV